MTVPQMVELFSTDGLSKNAAIFDTKKLEWMNGQHLGMMTAAELYPLVVRGLSEAGLGSESDLDARREWVLGLIDLLKVRSRTIDDIVHQAAPYLRETIDYDPDAVAKQWKDKVATRDILRAIAEALSAVDVWTLDATEASLRALAESRGLGAGKLFQPLRVALTGSSASPGIFDVLVVLGKAKSLARIGRAIETLGA
jgi:glutamyl-tRNA synthetase